MSNSGIEDYRYLLMTLDPVHVGTGGYRLGGIDLSIVREPGTNVPKIPGTSLNGVLRSYAAHKYGKPKCAGQGQGEEKHCGKPTCPICYTFGYASEKERGHAGVVSLFDAQIVLFPVYSMRGPVWVSTMDRLRDAGFSYENGTNTPQDTRALTTFAKEGEINLGWLMIDVGGKVSITPPNADDTEEWKKKEWDAISNKIVITTERMFSVVVNSNLEVRTSVSINPETGAAEEGALFTYEAIPRATWLWMDVVVNDYRGAFPSLKRLEAWRNGMNENEKERLEKAGWKDEDVNETYNRYKERKLNWEKPDEVVDAAFELTSILGIGGMGTRGFGRVKKVASWKHGSQEGGVDEPQP